jgi:DNA replication initiation complex subunit (GINS family)
MTEIDFLMDKMIDILIATSLGIFIMILHRRADKRVHDMVEDLHDYITKEHREVISKIQEMLEAEKKIDDDVHNMVEKQKKLTEELHSMSIAEQGLAQNIHTMVLEQQKLIKELHELSKKDSKL